MPRPCTNLAAQIVGLVNRSPRDLHLDLAAYLRLDSFEAGLAQNPDLVVMATNSDSHAELAIRAMQAGAHVFVEKPLATTVADAERMVAVVQETRRKLVVGYILRHPDRGGPSDIDGHTRVGTILAHRPTGDTRIVTPYERGHQALCDAEQAHVLHAIAADPDLNRAMQDAVQSLRICLAADESILTRRSVTRSPLPRNHDRAHLSGSVEVIRHNL
jgi:predicted dehydrogenase